MRNAETSSSENSFVAIGRCNCIARQPHLVKHGITQAVVGAAIGRGVAVRFSRLGINAPPFGYFGSIEIMPRPFPRSCRPE